MSSSSSDSGKSRIDRQLAVAAAASVFADKGFHNSTLEDTAAQVDTDIDNIRGHFRSTAEARYDVCEYGMHDYVERMNSIAESDYLFEAKLVAVVTFHVNKYQERFDSLTVYHTERLNLREPERSSLKELGDCYRDRLIRSLEEGVKSGHVRSSTYCKFAAQAVIGMCDRWGHLIASNPDLDMTYVIESCIDLLINGFIDKSSSDEISVRL